MRRKFLSVVLCVCMMFTMVPFAFAADDDEASAETTPVATITTTKHDTATGSDTTIVDKYDTLQAAIDAAKKGATVQLVADTNENVTVSKNEIVLDLNGHTLNGGTEAGKPALTVNNKKVTIIDTSADQKGTIKREDTAENSGKTSHYVIDIQGKYGFLKFEGGNVINDSGTADHSKGASLIRLGNDSVSAWPTLTITGGTFTQNNFVAIKVDRGTLHFMGGTVNSSDSYAIENWNNAYIKDGTVNGTVATWVYTTGAAFSKIEISNGTVNGNVYAVNYDNATDKTAKVYITGGTVTGELGLRSYNNGLVPIADESTALIDVTGGTFNQDPSKYLGEGAYIASTEGNQYEVVKSYLAKIDDTGYYTMDEAFHAVAEGQTITMQRDYTTNAIQNSGSKSFTIDLDGHTWTYTGSNVNSAAFEINYPNVTLTVKNGTVVSSQLVGLIPSASAMNGTITYDNSGLVFDGVTMTTTGSSGIESNGNNTNDNITLKNSTLNVPNGFGIYFPSSGSVKLEDSKINAKTMGVQVCAGSLNVKDSDITVTAGPLEKTEGDGAIEDGAAISVVDRTGYKGLGKVTVESGNFAAKSGNNAVKAYKWENNTEGAFNNSTGVIVISGGYFTTDPTSYLAANRYTVASNKDGYSYMVTQDAPATAPIIVTDKTEATVNETITDRDKEKINAVSGKTNIDGVAEAIDTNKKSSIVTAAGVDSNILGDSTKKIEVNVNVKVEVTSADLANNAITFTATPEATVKVNGSADNTKTVTIDNSYLNGKEITVKLPLPEQFKAEQIKHTSTDGSVEYFLLTEKRGAKTFTIDENNCAVFTITKFSTFEVSGKQTYVEPSSGGPGSSGGSISAPTTYAVNVNAATNGAVAADKKTASKGTTVTVTASPSKGYVVDAVKVVDKDGKDVAVTEKDGKYVFTMPASAVTVTGSFKAETPAPVALPFTDVKSGNWFYDAVKYAYAQGLMTGTSATTFAPNGTMNRAMIVTVLYRLEKSPAVTGASKFTDVPAGQWYSDAVAWAAANKIVNGYDETTFGPMNAVTREQMAAILFRYEQVKGLENVTLEENLNRFPDQNKISAYAIPALQWAVGQKIINGNADGTLDPTGTATRAQVAQIFTNLLNK